MSNSAMDVNDEGVTGECVLARETGHISDDGGHIQGLKCFPSWAPELGSRATGGRGDDPILRDAPLVREMQGKPPHCASTGKKRPRDSNSDGARYSRRHLPKVHGREVPLIADGVPEIEDWSICGKFGGPMRQLIAERMKNLRREYPDWCSSAYRLALGALLMCETRRVDVISMVHLLHLSAGETVLKFHHGSLSIYKGGYYSAIGDIAPDHLLSHCSVFAQTLEGLMLVIGYNGASSRKEEQVYKAVEAAYVDAIKMALIEKQVDGLGAVGMSDFAPIVNSSGP